MYIIYSYSHVHISTIRVGTYKFFFNMSSMKIIGLPTILHFFNLPKIKYKFSGGYKRLKQGGEFTKILYDNIYRYTTHTVLI